MDLTQFRQQYPQYNGVDDQTLADALYNKYYATRIPREAFDRQLGIYNQRDMTEAQKYGANINTGVKKGIADIIGLPKAAVSGVGAGLEKNLQMNPALGQPPDYATPDIQGQIGNMMMYDPSVIDAIQQTGRALPSREGVLAGEQLYRPETIGGSIGQAGVEGLVSGAPFGGPAALISGVGGAAGETVGQATAGTKYETPSRIAAAIIASGLAGLPGSIRGTPAALIHQATRGLTPAQWAMAQRLQQDANAIGVRITGAEALGENAPSLLQYQRMAEGAPGSSGQMARFMNQRPGQVQAAGVHANNYVGPPIADTQAATTAAQQAAEDAVHGAETGRTLATRPFYQAAAADQIPPAEASATIAAIDAQLAQQPAEAVATQLRNLRRDLIQEPRDVFPEAPKNAVDQLDSVRKYWRDRTNLPPIAAEATAREVNSRIGPILRDLRDSMSRASRDYAYGRALYEQITHDIVEPLQRSATGNLARTGELASQIALVADPAIARPDTIRAVIANLSQTNPAAARDLVRLHIENSFDRANKAIMSGPNQMGGAKFSVAIAGTPQQRANLEAAIRALPNGDAMWAGYRQMLDVFEATGRRLPAGSRTDENQAARAALQGGGVAGIVAGRGTMGLRLAEWYRDFRMNKNTAAFARILTSPDSVGLMRQLARTAPDSARAQTLVGALLQINQQRNSSGRSSTSLRLPPPMASGYQQPFSGSVFGGQ